VDVCPTGSILELNFPPRKVPVEKKKETKKNIGENEFIDNNNCDFID